MNEKAIALIGLQRHTKKKKNPVPILPLNIRALIVRHGEKQFLSPIFFKRPIHTDHEGHASYRDISCGTLQRLN